MRKYFLRILGLIPMLVVFVLQAAAQCAICTKTAQQLGEGPAKGLNAAILYLMIVPLTIIFFIGYRWYKKEKAIHKRERNS